MSFDTREITDPDLDVPPHLDPSNDTAPWRCTECGQPVPVGPSGRKPRLMLCEDHRKSHKGTSSNAGTSRAGTVHDRIQTGMGGLHAMLGFGVGLVAIPTGSDVWRQDSRAIATAAPNIGEAWAKYCDDNPKARKMILSFLETAGALSLAGAYAPMVIAIMMNHKTASSPAPVVASPPQMPQAPPTPFERPTFVPPTVFPPGGGTPLFQPSANGNGLPFPTDIVE